MQYCASPSKPALTKSAQGRLRFSSLSSKAYASMFVSMNAMLLPFMQFISVFVLDSAQIHALVQQAQSCSHRISLLFFLGPLLHRLGQRLSQIPFFLTVHGLRRPPELLLYLGIDADCDCLGSHDRYIYNILYLNIEYQQ